MLTPDLVEEFVRAFEAELAQLRKSAAGNRRVIASKLTDAERRLERVLRAIETGAWSESLQARLSELEQQRAALRSDLTAAEHPAPVVRLHPDAAMIYRSKVAELEASLSTPEILPEASDALRSLIDRVVLTPSPEGKGMEIELIGAIAAMLRLALGGAGAGRHADAAGSDLFCSSVKVVAGTRNTRSLRNGRAGLESPASVVAGARNTRFLRLIERTIPRLAA